MTKRVLSAGVRNVKISRLGRLRRVLTSQNTKNTVLYAAGKSPAAMSSTEKRGYAPMSVSLSSSTTMKAAWKSFLTKDVWSGGIKFPLSPMSNP